MELATKTQDRDIRFVLVNTQRVGRKNITQVNELLIGKKGLKGTLKEYLSCDGIETRTGTYCSLVMPENAKKNAEHIHTFMLEGGDPEKEYIPGCFIVGGLVDKSGIFEDLDTRIDKEWILSRLLLTVYRGEAA